MRSWWLRVEPVPDSPLTIGRATTRGVRASFKCDRTGPITVWSFVGQAVGHVVFHGGGRTEVACVEGRTVGFDVPWSSVRRGVRSAVQLYAVSGVEVTWIPPSEHRQAGWRTIR